jgi:hypothetical protein
LTESGSGIPKKARPNLQLLIVEGLMRIYVHLPGAMDSQSLTATSCNAIHTHTAPFCFFLFRACVCAAANGRDLKR